MRITRHKAFKKSLRFFKAAFDFVDPFHIIVDPTFIDSAVVGQIKLKEDLSSILAGRVTPMVTECVMCHLRRNGRTNTPALLIGKSCYRLKCSHDPKNPLSPADCIISQLEKENPRHFFIASQDDSLKARARTISGTPVLSIHGNLLMLESPSEESRKSAEHRELKRRLPKLSERNEDTDDSSNEDPVGPENSIRKKRRGGPNPLSIKKKKMKEMAHAHPGAEPRKKRVRSKRGNLTPLAPLVGGSLIDL
jgi:U3 small nucleolar RNA-associated protein 23